MRASARLRAAFIPRRGSRDGWRDIDYMHEITDAEDCGHLAYATILLREFTEKFLT